MVLRLVLAIELRRLSLLLVRLDALEVLKLADRQLDKILILFCLSYGGIVPPFNRAALGLAVFGYDCEIVEAGEFELVVLDLIVVTEALNFLETSHVISAAVKEG